MTASGQARIGLLGQGTVGGAFTELLDQQAGSIAEATGRRPEISGVLRRSFGDFEQILEDSDVIVEVMGGTDPTRELVLRALQAGRHVVTANKQLIARHGDELFAAADAAGVQLRFEAAVAGVVPVIRVIRESLAAARIERVFGIVNGTTNFILTEMAETGADYADALARAQQLGYAEADPSEDVNGADAAAKMAILARIAFGAAVPFDQVAYEGIEAVTPDDIAYAREFGLSLKLLGVAERRDDDTLTVRVFPCFLYPGHPLAPVEGPYNAVMVESEAITEITMSGPGAGGRETASAVLGDVVSILSGSAPAARPAESLSVANEVSSAFYVHLEVADRPGVLARVAAIFADAEISVRSVSQRGLGDDARLEIVTHQGPERAFRRAFDEIASLEFLRAAPRAIHVLEREPS
ncbi:MAG: homoserine dehydrogenase [Solirubrobacterales bacterium]